MMKIINAQQLFRQLRELHLENKIGTISFQLAGISVKINTTDTVGITLQAWLKQYFIDNNILFSEPQNTQSFPDFFLDNNELNRSMLEVKAFNYNAMPAFDIANFESYCESIKNNPYRLDADYLIFGYIMNNGDISIKEIWLHKIWEIAGTSQRFALKTQVKRDMIYNIRPNSEFKTGNTGPFLSKNDFLIAIYQTLVQYKNQQFADEWKRILCENYIKYFNDKLEF